MGRLVLILALSSLFAHAADHGTASPVGRAVWGSDAVESKYPEVGQVFCQTSSTTWDTCTATLLQNKRGGVEWIATSAHCIPRPDCHFRNANLNAKVVCHKYSRHQEAETDFAFCKFETPQQTDAGVCLATTAPAENERLHLVGYGNIPNVPNSGRQRAAWIPVVTSSEGRDVFGRRTSVRFSGTTIHVRDGRNHTFSGDSGGAGFRRAKDKRPALVGIISGGAEIEGHQRASILANVTSPIFQRVADEISASGKGSLSEICREDGSAPPPASRTQTPIPMERGTLVHDLVPNSPAVTAGFRKGDRVLSLNGDTAPDGEGWRAHVRKALEPGKTELTFVVLRDGKEEKLKVPAEAVRKNEGIVGLYLDGPPSHDEGNPPRRDLVPAPDPGAHEATRITKVLPGSAGEAGGLKAGDELLTMNGEPASTPKEWGDLIKRARDASVLKLLVFQVRRDGETKFIPVDAAKVRETGVVGVHLGEGAKRVEDPRLPPSPVPDPKRTETPSPQRRDGDEKRKIVMTIYSSDNCHWCTVLESRLKELDLSGVEVKRVKGAPQWSNGAVPATEITIVGKPGFLGRITGANVDSIKRSLEEARRF